jgi:hypothetical protein
MFGPGQADALVQAGAAVILVLLVGTIFVTGARELWVWGPVFKRSLRREELLRQENADLRAELHANTQAMAAMSGDFVRGLAELRAAFERELDQVTDELRYQRDRPVRRPPVGGPDAP